MAFDSVVWLAVKGVIKKNPIKSRAEEKKIIKNEELFTEIMGKHSCGWP